MAEKRPRSPSPEGKDRREHAGGFTIDLSAGRATARRRRKPQAVVTETIDLSTRTKPAPPPPDAPTAAPPPVAAAKPREHTRREGHSLADLLDAETLERLRSQAAG